MGNAGIRMEVNPIEGGDRERKDQQEVNFQNKWPLWRSVTTQPYKPQIPVPKRQNPEAERCLTSRAPTCRLVAKLVPCWSGYDFKFVFISRKTENSTGIEQPAKTRGLATTKGGQ